jgi:peptidoglycan/LPS O-acetylase OafA/YrhL
MREVRAEQGASFSYRPALDGLRAVAVGAVIAYHLGYGWARGGYLGVDTFFVLSGYLITSLLLVEFGGTGRIALRSFWARRARRLLPALFVVLAAVSLWAAYAWPSDQLNLVRGDGLWTLFYGANWRFIATGQSYFLLNALPSPFRHAWSLAIEEQFYLVWPIVVLACLRLGRGRTRVLAATCTVGACASIVLMAVLYQPTNPSRVYYGTDTRAHALLIGALLAIVLRHWEVRSRKPAGSSLVITGVRRRLGVVLAVTGVVAGSACIAAFALIPDSSSAMYRGGFALFAVAVAVVITAAVLPGPSPVRAFLALPPLVWIGRISYGLYLWHWPIQLALTPQRVGIDGVGLDLLRVGATVAIATASFYLIELPIRRGRIGRRLRVALAPVGAAGVAVVVLASTAGATPTPSYLLNSGSAGLKQALARVEAPVHGTTTTTPATTTVPTTTPPSTAAGAPPPPPATVLTAPAHSLLAVGDSLFGSLQPALAPVARARGITLNSIVVPGCGVFRGEPLAEDDTHLSWAAGCGTLVPRLQLQAVQRYRPDVVMWLSSWETADRIVDGQQFTMDTPDGIAKTNALIDETVGRLTSTGARVAFFTIAPTLTTLAYGAPTAEATKRVLLLDQLLENYAAAHPATTFIVPLGEQYCPGMNNCPETVSGISPRGNDGRHFSPQGAAWLAPWVLNAVTAPRPIPAPG